jgi:hypothetical protein
VELEVEVRAAGVLAGLRNGDKRMAYAIANSLNDQIKSIQTGERASVQRKFKVRARAQQFIERQSAYIAPSDFASATARRFQARVSVAVKTRFLLAGFETGAERHGFVSPRGRAAVPIIGGPARPSFGSSVPSAFQYVRLNIRPVIEGKKVKRGGRRDLAFRIHQTGTGKVQLKGSQRTFVLTHTVKQPQGGAYQRVGPKRGDLRLVYGFTRPKHLDRRLGYEALARDIARREFAARLLKQVTDTLNYQLTRGGH